MFHLGANDYYFIQVSSHIALHGEILPVNHLVQHLIVRPGTFYEQPAYTMEYDPIISLCFDTPLMNTAKQHHPSLCPAWTDASSHVC